MLSRPHESPAKYVLLPLTCTFPSFLVCVCVQRTNVICIPSALLHIYRSYALMQMLIQRPFCFFSFWLRLALLSSNNFLQLNAQFETAQLQTKGFLPSRPAHLLERETGLNTWKQ